MEICLDEVQHIGARLQMRFNRIPEVPMSTAAVSAKIKEVQVEHSSEPKHAGVEFPRYFTARLEAGKTPYDDVQWETRNATIGNDKGSVIFEQRDIEGPAEWSQTATTI